MTPNDPSNLSLTTDEELAAALVNPAGVSTLSLRGIKDERLIERVAEFSDLTTLSASVIDCRSLAPQLHRLQNLTFVNFQRCSLDEFPAELLHATNLTDLSLGNNSIETIPPEIKEFPKLQKLWISQNSLTELPSELFECPLETLVVSYNRLTNLPGTIVKLTNSLESLVLDANRLKELPEQIGSLERLRALYVNYNQLSTLPKSIARLESLKSLAISNNPFSSLPDELEALGKKLEMFQVDGQHRCLFMDWSWKPSKLTPHRELMDMQLHLTPNDSQFARIAGELKEAGAEMFAPRIRNTVSIDTTVPFVEKGAETVGCSRFGGFPDLIDETQLPRWNDGETCYIFLAQINLADVAQLNSFLPKTGLLSFFVDSLEDPDAKVVFYDGDLSRLQPIHFDPEDLSDPDCDNYTEKPHRLKFKNSIGLPYGYQQDLDEEAYEKVFDRYRSGPSQINGYTFTQHESPETQAANELGGRPEEWVCLLELDSHMDVGFCFWDAGTLTFVIHQEDLRRNDFSRVHVSLESS